MFFFSLKAPFFVPYSLFFLLETPPLVRMSFVRSGLISRFFFSLSFGGPFAASSFPRFGPVFGTHLRLPGRALSQS